MTLRVHPDQIVARSTNPLLGKHDSWERIRVSEVAEIKNGYAFKADRFNSNRDGVPLIRIRDVGRNRTDTYYSGRFEEQYWVESGDLVIGMDGDFRVSRWRGPRALLNQRVCRVRIRNSDVYDSGFLLHVLPSYLDAIEQHTSSVTVKHLSSRTVAEIPLPVPPIGEQRRIVAAIEEQFSRLDAAEASLGRVRDRLRALRHAVLARLMPEGVLRTRLGDVADVRLGRQRSPKNHTGPNMRPYLRAANVTWDGLDLSDVKQMNFDPDEARAFRLAPGDVLVGEASGSISEVGKPAVWRGELQDCCFQNTLLRVRSERFIPEYLYYQLLAAARWGWLARIARGVGIHHLGRRGLEELLVVVPDLDDQRHLVAEVEQLISIAIALEQGVQGAAARSRTLRASILREAFGGRLVPQIPSERPVAPSLHRSDRALA